MDITFTVKKQTLLRTDGKSIAENSLLYLKAVFDLDEDWSASNVVKKAVFERPDGSTPYHVMLGSQGCASNEAYVAPEVLRKGSFTVGLIGVKGSGNDVVRMTTNVITVNVIRSGALEGENSNVTPELADQIEAALGECETKSERVPYIGNDGFWYYYSYAEPEGWVKGEKAAGTDGVDGTNGKSAYQIAVDNGYTGTESQWLASLNGAQGDPGRDGINGVNGKSTYEIAVDNGYTGTEEQWLASLVGPAGATGANGKSAYEIAVDNGYTGTEEHWLASLKGDPGQNGSNGKSAYEIAVENGYTGTEAQWLASLVGPTGATGATGANGSNGSDGKSAYEVAVENGFVGTEAAWLASLVGATGPQGPKGDPGGIDYLTVVDGKICVTYEEEE